MWSPLWSPVVATGGERLQMARAGTGQKQAKTVAVGCNQLPPGPHGKEGADGSSRSAGCVNKAVSAASSIAGRACGKRMRQVDRFPTGRRRISRVRRVWAAASIAMAALTLAGRVGVASAHRPGCYIGHSYRQWDVHRVYPIPHGCAGDLVGPLRVAPASGGPSRALGARDGRILATSSSLVGQGWAV
jgi:hypothetical protein